MRPESVTGAAEARPQLEVELEALARLYAIALSLGRPAILADEEVGRIGERLKANGADIEARVAALVETRAKANRKAKVKAPAKAKRVARKRRRS